MFYWIQLFGAVSTEWCFLSFFLFRKPRFTFWARTVQIAVRLCPCSLVTCQVQGGRTVEVTASPSFSAPPPHSLILTHKGQRFGVLFSFPFPGGFKYFYFLRQTVPSRFDGKVFFFVFFLLQWYKGYMFFFFCFFHLLHNWGILATRSPLIQILYLYSHVTDSKQPLTRAK